MPRVGNPMSGYAGCRIHDTRKRCAGKLLCRIAHSPRHHPYLMRSEHITTLRRKKSSRNNLSKHWLRQLPASEWLIHPERDRSCTAFPAPQNGSCTMSKRLGSLRRITAARASRRRLATDGTADGRCHNRTGGDEGWGAQQPQCCRRTAAEHHHETRYKSTDKTRIPKIRGTPTAAVSGGCCPFQFER